MIRNGRLFIDFVAVSLDDPEPEGYVAWHEWAELQSKANRTQQRCPKCLHFWWPHTGICKTCEKREPRE